jgi:HlyD family secretion protein
LFLLAAIPLLVVAYFTWAGLNSKTSSVTVSKRDLVIDQVSLGELIRDVRAPGTLQPNRLRWIASSSQGRIEQILIQPGEKVSHDSVIMVLSNPSLTRALEGASYALEVAEAEFIALEKRLKSNYLAQQAVINEVEAQFQNASFRLEANDALSDLQIVSALDAKENQLQQGQLKSRLQIEQKRLDHLAELHQAELNAKQAQVNQTRSQLRLQQSLVNDLQVKAGLSGILQDVPVEQGQQIAMGVVLARVAEADNLKAELRVQESQAKDILLGQKVTLSAGGFSTAGSVSRIDPAVQSGTVIVDVSFAANSLQGARPDLRVSGTIEISRLTNVLTLRRPVQSQENTETLLYVLQEDGAYAVANSVQLGQGSLDKIEIIDGLSAGQQVIVSDTSRFNQQPNIAIN